jgi:hypothetical protein
LLCNILFIILFAFLLFVAFKLYVSFLSDILLQPIYAVRDVKSH